MGEILTRDALVARVRAERAAGRTVAFANLKRHAEAEAPAAGFGGIDAAGARMSEVRLTLPSRARRTNARTPSARISWTVTWRAAQSISAIEACSRVQAIGVSSWPWGCHSTWSSDTVAGPARTLNWPAANEAWMWAWALSRPAVTLAGRTDGA